MVGHIERFNPASRTITATGGVAHADYLEQSLEIWE